MPEKTPEQIYDEEIAPALLKIGKRCEELGFSIAASVEWKWGETGQTIFLADGHSAKQLLVHWAIKCHGNVDSLIMAIDRHSQKHGHSSICLKMLGNNNVKYSGNEMAALTVVTPGGSNA